MRIERVFLGLERPALQSAAEWLIERATDGHAANLENTIVVLPGGRAGRRLLEILVDVAERRQLMLAPPKIDTVGRFPERLYPLKYPLASDLTQQLAWAQVLKTADRTLVSSLMADPPTSDDAPGWLELGDLLRRQHTALAADGLDFSDVAREGANLEGFTEATRWRMLSKLQQSYLRLLDGLELWDVQTARLEAIKRRECRAEFDVVLIGTVDMNNALRRMIDQVVDRVTALVFAPESWADRFDKLGCLDSERWTDVELPLKTEQVEVVEGHADQADAVVARIASLGGNYRADEITIGVPDERIVATLRRRLAEFSLPCRFGPGRLITTTGPYTLLVAVAKLLESQRFADFAALVRHPDVYDWLGSRLGPADWLTILDRFQGERIPGTLGELSEWLAKKSNVGHARPLFEKIAELLQDLSGERQLGDWTPGIVKLLETIYGHQVARRHVEAERLTLSACQTLNEILQHHPTVPKSLAPLVTAAAAIRFLLDHAASERVSEAANQAALEMLGWLELSLDDAPALIVTSCNEGFVPNSVNSDLFLPNSLRAHLGLEDNSRRFARDTYSLATMVESKKSLHLIVGRRNADREPLVPSRLLFAADRETIARRVLAFFEPARTASVGRALPRTLVPRLGSADFPIPQPEPHDRDWSALSVTAFRAYLACPYRFYLRYVCGLKTVRDDAVELDGAAFGNLLHDVVKWFGTSKLRDSDDAVELEQTLRRQLFYQAEKKYGEHPPAAIAIQLQQLALRLKAFAAQQASWVADGWRIKQVEVPAPQQALTELDVDGQGVRILGRIDRIDFRESTGEWAILDYKTSDAGSLPDRTHRHGGEWVDLQLPLYRHFVASSAAPDAKIRLGYVLLPKDVTNVKLALADWAESDLVEADEVARTVVRRIRRQEFWPPTDPPPPFADEFAAICQDDVFDKWRPA